MKNAVWVVVLLCTVAIALVYQYRDLSDVPDRVGTESENGELVLKPGHQATGTVTAVLDGDSIRFRNSDYKAWEVRVNAIDAPEYLQDFGREASDALRRLCANQVATMSSVDTDRYGRTVADVTCNGTSVKDYMVRNGLAWAYGHNRRDNDALVELQETAKSQRIGLWSGDNPIEPEEYRRLHPLYSPSK